MILFTKDGDVRIYSESEIRKLLDNTGFKGFEWEQISMSAFIVLHLNKILFYYFLLLFLLIITNCYFRGFI